MIRLSQVAATLTIAAVVAACTSTPNASQQGLPAKPTLSPSSPGTSPLSTTEQPTSTPLPITSDPTATTAGQTSRAAPETPESSGLTTEADDYVYSTFQGTQREYIDAYRDCMESQGLRVKVAEDGGMTFPGATNDSVSAASEHCLRQIGVIQTQNFTEEQLRAYYALQSAQWECVRDAGYPVAPAQSWQTYLDTAQQNGAPYWDVFAGLARDQVNAALAQCPNKVMG